MSEPEVFISYSHRDNKSKLAGKPGWVEEFEQALTGCLAEELGREPVIFRDQELPRDKPFPKALADRLKSAKAFVCVLSPNYINSKWCRKELDTFLELAESKPQTTVLKVRKHQVGIDKHPDAIRDLLGFQFFDKDLVPMSPALDPSTTSEYMREVHAIAKTMCETLQSTSEDSDDPEESSIIVPRGEGLACKVFLADTTWDIKGPHRDLKWDLIRHGHQVVPDRNLPRLPGDIEEFVQEQLTGCSLSIHLFGANYSMEQALLHDQAVKFSKSSPLRRVIWISGEGESDDKRQSDFIKELRIDNATHDGADLLEGSFEELKTVVYRRLEPEPERDVDFDTDSETLRVYVVCDQADGRNSAPLEDHLYSQGLEVIESAFGAPAKVWLSDHLRSISRSDGVLIYYGAGNVFWQRKMVSFIDQARGYDQIQGLGRDRPLRAVAIYLAPPQTPEKERFRSREWMVVKEGESLNEFVRRIKDGRARRTG